MKINKLVRTLILTLLFLVAQPLSAQEAKESVAPAPKSQSAPQNTKTEESTKSSEGDESLEDFGDEDLEGEDLNDEEFGDEDFTEETPPQSKETCSQLDILRTIQGDLESLSGYDRKYTRYFSLYHFECQGLSEDEYGIQVRALTKMINSLSWSTNLFKLQPINGTTSVFKSGSIFRIDLRDILLVESYNNFREWDQREWDFLVNLDPYHNQVVRKGFLEQSLVYKLNEMTYSSFPYLRGDFFVKIASASPNYERLLGLPTKMQELESILGIDTERNVLNTERLHIPRGKKDIVGSAVRIGFGQSGVSQNNRIIERHLTPYGAYWISYDFSSNRDRQNIFQNPLGPSSHATNHSSVFQHAGGEIIFNLPNGLQAYYLADNKGNRLAKGPTNIVSHVKRPDRAVENAVSCMDCHSNGLIKHADAIRPFVLKNQGLFDYEEQNAILALYPENSTTKKLMDEDIKRFTNSLNTIGAQPGADEVIQVVLGYENSLDATQVSSELGVSKENLVSLSQYEEIARELGPLSSGSRIKRDSFEEFVKELNSISCQDATGYLKSPCSVDYDHRDHHHSGYHERSRHGLRQFRTHKRRGIIRHNRKTQKYRKGHRYRKH